MTATVLERPVLFDSPRPATAVPAPRHDRHGVDAPGRLEPIGGRAGLSSPAPDGSRGRRLGTAALVVAGAAPVLAIPAQILGLAPAAVSTITAVASLGLVALVIALARLGRVSTGLLAGAVTLAAVAAVQMPLVAAGVWPDFVPAMGGQVLGSGTGDASLFSVWRMLGEGGVGMFGFMLAGLLLTVRPHWISGRTGAVAVGYGVFAWTGLVAALMLPGGPATASTLSAAGFLGHLAYGAVLGLGLLVAVRRITLRREQERRTPTTA